MDMMNQIQFCILTENGIKGVGADWLSAISIMILFVLVLFGAYFTTRFLAKHQSNRMKNCHLKIIEAIQVGPGKTVQLMKIGDEFIAIGVTKDKITYLKSIDQEHLDLKSIEEGSQIQPFNHYLEKFRNRKKSEKQS